MSGKERKGKEKGRGEGDGSKKRACRLGKEAMDGGRKTEMKTDWKTTSQRCAEAVVEALGSRRCVRGPSDQP